MQDTYQSLPLETKVLYLFNAVQNESGDIDEKQVAAVMLRRLMANEFTQFFPNVSAYFPFMHCIYFLWLTDLLF